MNITEYINQFKGVPFEWGKNDCYTFTRGWIDIKYPDKLVKLPAYSSIKEAHNLNLTYDWFLEIRKTFNFKIVEEPEDGDLFIIKDGFQCAHLVGDGRLWSMDKVLNLVGTDVNFARGKPFIRILN